MIFLLGPIDFGNIVMLRTGPNSCGQQNFKCFDMPLLSLGLFHDDCQTNLNMFFKPQPGLGPQCPVCAGISLRIACQGTQESG